MPMDGKPLLSRMSRLGYAIPGGPVLKTKLSSNDVLVGSISLETRIEPRHCYDPCTVSKGYERAVRKSQRVRGLDLHLLIGR